MNVGAMRCFCIGFVIVRCFLPTGLVFSQPQKTKFSSADSSHVNITRLSVFGGTVLAGGAAVYFGQVRAVVEELLHSFFFS